MQTMNISLPASLKRFVDAQVISGHYSSVSEYVRELIRMDAKRKAQDTLQGMHRDEINSPSTPMTSHWNKLTSAIHRRRRGKSPK
jgi:antitoxin ParD1/3/4